MSTKLAVILGAGPVGRATALVLLQRGHQVRFVTRTGEPIVLAGHPQPVPAVAADVRDAAALVEAAQGADILLHAVGVPYQKWAAELPALQNAVLEAAEKTGAVLVLVENLYSYTADQMPLTEASSERPPTRKGALRLALSQQWLRAHAEGRVKAVAVRASDYFGPGATRSPNSHFGARFFPGLEAGKSVAFLGSADAKHSYTYLPDFARALADVALAPDTWGKAWICPSLEVSTAREVTAHFAKVSGRTVKVGSLPAGLIRFLGLFDPLLKEVGEMLYQFDREFTVDATAFEQRFGWKATKLEAAAAETWKFHAG